jgi:hypothetical protein
VVASNSFPAVKDKSVNQVLVTRGNRSFPGGTSSIVIYEKLLATIPEIERKGANNPFTALKGNMFSLLLSPAGRMALRHSKDDREQFLKKYKTTLFETYGTVMQEYVSVPDALLANARELRKYLALSYAYAKTLQAKSQKRK